MDNRGAYIAALGFPVLVIIGGIVGFTLPDAALTLKPATNYLLGVIMSAWV